MQLIDTHCHLYLPEFAEDIAEVIQRASSAGVSRCYLPNIDRSSLNAMLQLEKQFPGQCIAMMGLHPCSVNENVKEELQIVENQLSSRKYVAVGEIGLDFYWDKTHIKQQYEAFRQQIEWALQYDIPVVIHSRDSIDECIEVVSEYASRGTRGVFHCFGGTIEQANKISALGFYMGIGGVVTYKKAGLENVLDKVDLQWLVLETDAPYLTPVPFRGKRNESSYLHYVAARLAEIKNMPVEEIAATTTANALRLFGA